MAGGYGDLRGAPVTLGWWLVTPPSPSGLVSGWEVGHEVADAAQRPDVLGAAVDRGQPGAEAVDGGFDDVAAARQVLRAPDGRQQGAPRLWLPAVLREV